MNDNPQGQWMPGQSAEDVPASAPPLAAPQSRRPPGAPPTSPDARIQRGSIRLFRVAGIDAWGWDAPFVHTRKRWLETRDASIIWEGHKAGREIPYCHMEKLCNLDQLPPNGFTVACFPHKIKGASAGWTRAVALFE